VSLKSAFTANVPVKVTSVVLSIFLWFLAAGEENASTLLPVDVAIRAPEGRTLLQPAGPLHALVVGPRRELLKLSATPLRLSRILADTILADEVRLDLDPGDLEVPQGISVRVQDVEPRMLVVRLDSTFQRVVPVRAVVRLRPETGFALGAISVVPGTIRLLGSRESIQSIDSARTEPLEIAEADGPVEDVVNLDTSGFGTVRVLPQEVTVRVDVERVRSRTFAGVPIRLSSETAGTLRPAHETVRVRVSGAAGRLATLTADSLYIVVDGADSGLPRRVGLRVISPTGVAARTDPDSVDLVRRSGRG
jgi:hypothetical protein